MKSIVSRNICVPSSRICNRGGTQNIIPTSYRDYCVMLCYTRAMQTTIYIRKENQDKWNEIKDKSLFVNIALGQMDEDPMPRGLKPPPVKKKLPAIPGVSLGTANLKPQPMCKHGQRGNCPVKGCA